MGKYLIFIAGFSATLLASCTTNPAQQPASEGRGIYSTGKYSVSAPPGFAYSEPAPSGEYYYFGYPDNNNLGIKTVEIYEKNSCPPLGIIEPKQMQFEGGKGTWAKMPINRAYEDKLFCMPPHTDKCTEEAYWSSGCNDGSAAYAFCAEKDGKAVAICIQQMTDNEALAKQIFESFKWTD